MTVTHEQWIVCTGQLIWYNELVDSLVSNKIKVHCLLAHIMYAVYKYVYIDSNFCGDRTWNHMRLNVECAFATLISCTVRLPDLKAGGLVCNCARTRSIISACVLIIAASKINAYMLRDINGLTL